MFRKINISNSKKLTLCSIVLFFLLLIISQSLLAVNPKESFASELPLVEFSFYDGPPVTPQGFSLGPDGNMWFTEPGLNKIGRITTNGTITHFPLSNPIGNPIDLTAGADGNIWYTRSDNKIGKISPTGVTTEFILPSDISYAGSITLGPDNNIWFTAGRGKVGKITSTGEVNLYYLPTSDGDIGGFAIGADNNLWYTIQTRNKIGKISTDGVSVEYQLPENIQTPVGITAGADGNIWFTALTGKVGKITPTGEITAFPVISSGMFFGINSGPDGNLWIIENALKIGKLTPAGAFTEYDISASSFPNKLLSGIDNSLWYAAQNKIGRINIYGLVTPTLQPSVTPTITPQLTLTDYKQTDPRWSGARLQNSSGCGTMYGFGCAVTSVADVFYSYGKIVLSNAQLNPGTLNSWLANNKGLTNCSIIWGKASTAIGLGAPAILFRNYNNAWNAGKQAIDNAISGGNLPILGITTNTGLHFFAVSSKLPDVNGKPDYKIVDPALYPFVVNNPGNTGKPLSQTYGGFDKVIETVIYKKGTSSQKSLTIRAHSPVQMLITDPAGNKTGYNESNQTIIEDIPESAYGIEPGIAPVDGSAPAMGETKYFQQIDPSDGEYKVQLIGTGDGSYTVDFTKTDEQGNASTEEIKGYAQNKVTETYTFQYTPDASQIPVIEKEVTFQVLKSDLKGLYSQGQVKNKLTYETLKLTAEVAEKASLSNKQPMGNNLAILALKTMQFELNRQRGKNVTENAYQILYKDAEMLIKNLQGDSVGPTSTPTPTPRSGGT